ncbi:PilC/PilY family type IV pilus protein [Desulfobacterales bacterium HSG17]|nr:PilC/PilY family type IV pilus protein [Desulfobacterales bacterium HSG17]
MNNIQIKMRGALLLILFSLLCSLFYGQALAADASCSDNFAVPPFLSAGVDPNLLLIIDNSGSMYDMAYIDSSDDASTCVDGRYDGTTFTSSYTTYDSSADSTWYAGYFDLGTWYEYIAASNHFAESDDTAYDPTGGNYYYSTDVKLYVSTDSNTVKIKAKGNFWNWATSSKFDIQKEILTGGKYDAANDYLTSENRGCSGRRFIKQLQVSDGTSTFYLILGVHPNSDDVDGLGLESETTVIDLFQVNEDPFNSEYCQEAIDLMAAENTSLGQLKTAINKCMQYDTTGSGSSYTGNVNGSYNQAVQSCWYADEHGWKDDDKIQHVTSLQNQCQNVYEDFIHSDDIDPSSPAYVCADDYIGRCWKDPIGDPTCSTVSCDGYNFAVNERCDDGNLVEVCDGWKNNKCPGSKWEDKTTGDCSGGVVPGEWDAGVSNGYTGGDAYDDNDSCVVDRLKAFCGVAQVPEVIDPSDLTTSTGETWNLPAMITDTGAEGQLGDPIATLVGRLSEDTTPSGLIQDYADDIRIGAMKFNADGSLSECDTSNTHINKNCDAATNHDGGQVLVEIDMDEEGVTTHSESLVTAINGIKADSWTPLAEALYSAIAYYTENYGLLDEKFDISTGSDPDFPCTDWCQDNNILVITEGASTADQNEDMMEFAANADRKDPDTDNTSGCGDLFGSTFLDDLSHYAQTGTDLFSVTGPDNEAYQNLKTYFVVAGTIRDEGSGECSPKTLLENAAANGGTTAPYFASNPTQLEEDLTTIFNLIRTSASAGSAASVIAATRSGEGAIYQAIFWPSLLGPTDKPDVTWAGEVHSLFVDASGNQYEDTNGNRTLDSGDNQVTFYFDESDNETKVCYGTFDGNGNCSGTIVGLDSVNYLWSASEWLADVSDIETNRTDLISLVKERIIYTWNDIDNDGVAYGDDSELIPFVASTNWEDLDVSVADVARKSVPTDFGVTTDAQVDAIVNWVRGKDSSGLRSRELNTPDNFTIAGDPDTITWRLGDIIYSTPTAVGRPAEGYHLIYKDASYAKFYNQYKDRRNVIYFGGNDGMIHAVNGGFFSADLNKFCLSAPSGGSCGSDSGPALGAELWAYVPYNLLPHLQCLTAEDYEHQYYVDLKPSIFDVQIFPNDATHPNGWGTILVAGMRMGGNKVSADADASVDSRVFTSSYVVIDITDPENPPALLGELTYDPASNIDIGFATNIPVVVPIKTLDDPRTEDIDESEGANDQWYLLLGSGPDAFDGTSSDSAKIGVFPLANLIAGTPQPFRIPNSVPALGSPNFGAGSYDLTATSPTGFVSDPIAVDYDLDFKADVLYFGTVEGTWDAWDGNFYRIPTDESISNLWTAPGIMLDVGRPITSAPSIGYDGFDYWVYFGTGRYFDAEDKNDPDPSSGKTETFYGLKEPVENGSFTWDALENETADGSETAVGDRGLVPVTGILTEIDADVRCESDVGCVLPKLNGAEITTLGDLETYVDTYTDGWKKDFTDNYERNLGQGTLLGGLLAFTTYLPSGLTCGSEGNSYLYGLYYKTGTAWYAPVFGDDKGVEGEGETATSVGRLSLGRGMAITPNLHVGAEEGAKAFAQTSTGAIVEIPMVNLPIGNYKTGRTSWKGLR